MKVGDLLKRPRDLVDDGITFAPFRSPFGGTEHAYQNMPQWHDALPANHGPVAQGLPFPYPGPNTAVLVRDGGEGQYTIPFTIVGHSASATFRNHTENPMRITSALAVINGSAQQFHCNQILQPGNSLTVQVTVP